MWHWSCHGNHSGAQVRPKVWEHRAQEQQADGQHHKAKLAREGLLLTTVFRAHFAH